jgi:hypothetical protein
MNNVFKHLNKNLLNIDVNYLFLEYDKEGYMKL